MLCARGRVVEGTRSAVILLGSASTVNSLIAIRYSLFVKTARAAVDE
jgi:hypothetical protein